MGTPYVSKFWTPLLDQTMPEDTRFPFFNQWITSYFNHGDLTTRDVDVLSYVVPAFKRAPTLFGFDEDEVARMTYAPPAIGSDMTFMVSCGTVINASYKKACFDKAIRGLIPYMKITELCGTATPPFGIPAFWAMQDDDKANGGGFINFRLVPNINHFVCSSSCHFSVTCQC